VTSEIKDKKANGYLIGGSSAVVFMGSNKGYLVIGTSNSTIPVEVNKRTFVITPLTIISQIQINGAAEEDIRASADLLQIHKALRCPYLSEWLWKGTAWLHVDTKEQREWVIPFSSLRATFKRKVTF
jgi:hypothetical protein